MIPICYHFPIAAILLLTLAACGKGITGNDELTADSGQIKLEIPENSLEGIPHSFHGKKTGSCSVTSFAGPVIRNGYFRAEISQTDKMINIQLFCAPNKNSTSGYKLYTTGDLSIEENTLKGPTIQSGKIGRKALKLILLPLNGIQYTITALVSSRTQFEVTALYEDREVEQMSGEL